MTLGTWSEASISHLPDEQEAPYLGMAEAWQVGSRPTCWEDRYPTPELCAKPGLTCVFSLILPIFVVTRGWSICNAGKGACEQLVRGKGSAPTSRC